MHIVVSYLGYTVKFRHIEGYMVNFEKLRVYDEKTKGVDIWSRFFRVGKM